MSISMSLAQSMTGASITPARNTSLGAPSYKGPHSAVIKELSLYKGITERPLGWKPRRTPNPPRIPSIASKMGIRKWDGPSRQSEEWDCLRRDPELWFPDGNCLVHLYEQGQSKRGPAFQLPMWALLTANCHPLVQRFMAKSSPRTPPWDSTSNNAQGPEGNNQVYELYIPAPATAERGQAFLYHTATRNFFAFIFGKSLVGNHLGCALVGLLNSMNEFRSHGEENIQAIMDYMDEKGYADMRNHPDHALGVLFFAEHFHFKNLYIDAFAHCTGMHEKLSSCSGFEFISRPSRALITRSRFEMDMRLDRCGRLLGGFLSDDLSDAHLGLSTGARAHLDKFRTFLHSYYIAKLGYYPPMSQRNGCAAFPKHIYGQMCGEFRKLYEFLVDSNVSASGVSPVSQQGGICVLQSIQEIDRRHKYTPLNYPLPLLPKGEDEISSRPALGRRLSILQRYDKIRPDQRLVSFSSLSKATNRHDHGLLECTLVRAYRGFEKDCVFSPLKAEKSEKLSQSDARKVRWILIYSILQTLLSATKVPDEVRDTQNVSYNLSVITAGCPPWKEVSPYTPLLRSQIDQTREDFLASQAPKRPLTPTIALEIKPDLDYLALAQKSQKTHVRETSSSTLSSMASRKSTVRKALSTLGNMPELRHPKPLRASYHEILIHGYGNGTNIVNISAEPLTIDTEFHTRKTSSDSGSSRNDVSSRWSHSEPPDSPVTSVDSFTYSRRGSDVNGDALKTSIQTFLDKPMNELSLPRVPSSIYSSNENDTILEDEMVALQPDPLALKGNGDGGEEFMRVTKEVKVEWEMADGKANDELLGYLQS